MKNYRTDLSGHTGKVCTYNDDKFNFLGLCTRLAANCNLWRIQSARNKGQVGRSEPRLRSGLGLISRFNFCSRFNGGNDAKQADEGYPGRPRIVNIMNTFKIDVIILSPRYFEFESAYK